MRHKYYQRIDNPKDIVAIEQDEAPLTGYSKVRSEFIWGDINRVVIQNYYNQVSRKVAQKASPELFRYMRDSNALK